LDGGFEVLIEIPVAARTMLSKQPRAAGFWIVAQQRDRAFLGNQTHFG
jgi:hypothetical protein